METESEQLPQDRWYWGWYGIFITLLGISPFIPRAYGIPCAVIGIGGLLIQMREGFKTRVDRIRQFRISRSQLLAFMRIAAVGMLIILGIKTVSLVFSINNAFDVYIKPRDLTEEQATKLREYLSKRESSTVQIITVWHDKEADHYATQLFFALRQTKWDVNPPNRGGPAYVRLAPYIKRPEQNAVDTNGKPLYKTFDDYMKAYDEWMDAEMRRKLDEQNYDATGICLFIPTKIIEGNPDPRLPPTPGKILEDALHYAGIEAGCGGGAFDKDKDEITILVGHRPNGIR